jgi:arginine metabolism regulation protein II
MLHQIFLFQRIIEESTFIYPDWATCAPPSTGPIALEYRTLQYPSLQTLYFCRGVEPPRSFPGALEVVIQGGQAKGKRSLTLFEEIYGIPEPLLSLLSKTTSLSNEIMASKMGVHGGLLIDTDLIVRSKELELQILEWRATEVRLDDASYIDHLMNLEHELDSDWPETRLPESGKIGIPAGEFDSTPARSQASISLNLAIYHGLQVYFYRRVSNLDPSLLQFHVDAIINLLRHCRHDMSKVGIINCGIVWPGFLAAVEALGSQRQASIRSFLRESSLISGMRSFDVAIEVAEEVWQLRAENGNLAASWVDVLAGQGRAIVLT